ncbi:YbaN family protein [Kamptonema cortianum]|nr:YbaN family protein [Geitlerinema splendidum]MDK3160356.1 YbaN family protein [Kamptonema cortianum]
MRWLWTLGGFGALGTGIAGIYVPGLPTTVFLLIALYMFTRAGNDKQREWILNHPVFGSVISDWEENKWLSLKVKWIACVSIVVSCSVSAVLVGNIWVSALIVLVGAFGATYVVTRRTKPSPSSHKSLTRSA